jgi:GTP 3',8-cyclase
MLPVDTLGRPLRNLRLSVTDRCNLRCEYCMPEENYVWLPRQDLLTFDEICALVDVFMSLGVDKVRLTGGEPLLRRELPRLLELLAARPGLRDIALTTNGVLLADQADALKAAGLQRVTVSLDTLRRDRLQQLARVDALAAIHAGITAARRVFGCLKLDVVVIKGFNDDELLDLLEFARDQNAEVRFIEYMDVGGATRWSPDRVMSRREILEVMAARYGLVTPLESATPAPADRFALPDGTVFGIVASTTTPFCRSCDRSRLTADGMWYLCLYAANRFDLRKALRNGATPAELQTLIADAWCRRDECGAEQRLALSDRRGLVPVNTLRRDPHLEMHTRGG